MDLGAPIDVLWFRMSREPSDPWVHGHFRQGGHLRVINRGDYWQCG